MKKKSFQISKTIRKFAKPKFNVGQLVRTTDTKKVFSKRDSTNLSYKYKYFN